MDQGQSAGQINQFSFEGNGGEYFRIWIVNLALTILTVGVYSAWAKVRRLKYFYQNTHIADGSFDFHGSPAAILKGRIIAVILLLAYNFSGLISPALSLVTFALLLSILPWLVVKSLRFKLHNSSYRNLRFSFRGTIKEGYIAFLLYPLFALFTLYLLTPLAHHRIKLFQHTNSWFGNSRFDFNRCLGKFFRIYALLFLMIIVAIAAMVGSTMLPGLINGIGGEEMTEEQASQFIMTMAGIFIAVYLLLFLFLGPWFAARTQNLVWNNTSVEQNEFISKVRARDLFWIYLTNFLGIVVTLGLFKPFADIRLARYRLEHMALRTHGDVDAFMADQQHATSAMGEETAELFDFDISF